MSEIKYPKSLEHLSQNELKNLTIKCITMSQGVLCHTLYDNIEQFLNSQNIDNFIGPFIDKIGDRVCVRFESHSAADHLSR